MEKITAAPGNHDSRPPVVEPAPLPGAAAKPIRATARQRAIITPIPWETTNPAVATYPSNHRYVRRYWTATIGPGAVADLLRHAYSPPRMGQAVGQAPKCRYGRRCVRISQIVLTDTFPRESSVSMRASARLGESHSCKGRTHETEALFHAIGQSETDIRCS